MGAVTEFVDVAVRTGIRDRGVAWAGGATPAVTPQDALAVAVKVLLGGHRRVHGIAGPSRCIPVLPGRNAAGCGGMRRDAAAFRAVSHG
jgi:hypothetical protein